ncbi:hypothetical protein DFJ63DRAFT_321005 [Scheffersomyces coipomensis]|uniref:uncharacterized protein n=1 Tax=Scheffersomyces coipomensis TaxID=1788519 RepID=UPI00315C7B57
MRRLITLILLFILNSPLSSSHIISKLSSKLNLGNNNNNIINSNLNLSPYAHQQDQSLHGRPLVDPLNPFVTATAHTQPPGSTPTSTPANGNPPSQPQQPILLPLPSLKFPKWLTDFTGLTEWPGMDPPYIPLDFINFNNIPPHIPIHQQGQCSGLNNGDLSQCSFDCFNCVSFDDVYTCPKLSQTFDDGPSPYTLKLLDNLKTKSTFFTLGVQIIRYPEIYRKTVEKGHIMGSHTWSHKFLPGLSNEQIIAQLEWSIWAMNATNGHLPKWFRPPYGGIDNRIRSIIRQFGMQAVLWDFDTFDWKLLDATNYNHKPQDIYSNLNQFKINNGGKGLILEHDAVINTVDIGIEINHKILQNEIQFTVPQCVGGIDYIKKFEGMK